MNKILLYSFLLLIPFSSNATVFLGLEYGYGIIENIPTEHNNDAVSLGSSLYKRFKFGDYLLDTGFKYSKYSHDIRYNSGPYYSGNLDYNNFSLKLSPGIYLKKNIGLTIENGFFLDKKQQVSEKEYQSGFSGIGFFYDHKISERFSAKTSLSYNRGWNFDKKTDFIVVEISIGFDSPKKAKSHQIPKNQDNVDETIDKTLSQYPFNSTELSPFMMSKLDEIIEVLNISIYNKIIIEGHSDKHGTDRINNYISKERAKKVRDYLVKKGVSESKILYIGKGKKELLSQGDDRQHNRRNRRVTIKVEFNTKNENYKKMTEIQ